MSSTSRIQKLNRPPEGSSWTWRTSEMLESPARLALTGNAIKVIESIERELMRKGGTRNGQLIITYADFVRAGVRRNAVREAIEVAVQLGFIRRTDTGKVPWAGQIRAPSRYELTWLPVGGIEARNDWTKITTAGEARAAVLRAKYVCEMLRKGPSRHCRQSKKSKHAMTRRRQNGKQSPSIGIVTGQVTKPILG